MLIFSLETTKRPKIKAFERFYFSLELPLKFPLKIFVLTERFDIRMTKDKFEEYVELMIRRKEAIKLKTENPEMFMKYQKAYDKIDIRLKEEYKAFAAYVITDGKNTMPEEYLLFIGRCFNPIWEKVREGYRENDVGMMLQYLTVLRNIYSITCRIC